MPETNSISISDAFAAPNVCYVGITDAYAHVGVDDTLHGGAVSSHDRHRFRQHSNADIATMS